MLYRPIWLMLFFTFRVFIKRMHFAGHKNYITNKPVIMPCNHVNAFMDPIMIASQVWPSQHYMVRGDIFKTKFASWVLWQMYQIPLFRQRDGKDNLKKNEASYERCYDILKQNQRIMIFPEGDCIQEKHMRPVKKGTARMAFGAIQKHGWDMDLHIMPNSVHYTHPSEFRTSIGLVVGEPIRLLDYRELYEQDEAKALTTLSRDIEAAIKKIYVQMDNRADLDAFETLIEIERNNKPYRTLPWREFNDNFFKREKGVADLINHYRMYDEKEIEKINKLAKEYSSTMKKLNIRDKDFSEHSTNLFLGVIIGILGLPIFLLSTVLFGLQFYIADFVAKKKIRLLIFKNSIRLGIAMVSTVIFAVIAMIILAFSKPLIALALPFVLTGIGWLGVNYFELMRSVFAKIRFIQTGKKRPRDLKALFIQRKKLEKVIAKVGKLEVPEVAAELL